MRNLEVKQLNNNEMLDVLVERGNIDISERIKLKGEYGYPVIEMTDSKGKVNRFPAFILSPLHELPSFDEYTDNEIKLIRYYGRLTCEVRNERLIEIERMRLEKLRKLNENETLINNIKNKLNSFYGNNVKLILDDEDGQCLKFVNKDADTVRFNRISLPIKKDKIIIDILVRNFEISCDEITDILITNLLLRENIVDDMGILEIHNNIVSDKNIQDIYTKMVKINKTKNVTNTITFNVEEYIVNLIYYTDDVVVRVFGKDKKQLFFKKFNGLENSILFESDLVNSVIKQIFRLYKLSRRIKMLEGKDADVIYKTLKINCPVKLTKKLTLYMVESDIYLRRDIKNNYSGSISITKLTPEILKVFGMKSKNIDIIMQLRVLLKSDKILNK